MSDATPHRVELEEIRVVVAIRPQCRRAVYGTRHLLRCSCGWTSGPSDYINAIRNGRAHAGVARVWDSFCGGGRHTALCVATRTLYYRRAALSAAPEGDADA